ncbi:MAG: DUF4867 family protein [Ruminococcaceae bacterium]|nr:DUF4867 family protein [Oscillospiraceae bacterium]
MQIKQVSDPAFCQYGKILKQDFSAFLEALNEHTPRPDDSVIYVPSDSVLEGQPAFQILRDCVYGGMPIQIGYCNGSNRKLNCLEYHRGSEVNIAADSVVLLLTGLQKVHSNCLDTKEIEAFLVPKGTAVLLYETTLHYAPCNEPGGDGFRVAIVLPRGTNEEKPAAAGGSEEDRLLWARNKWLIAHPDSGEAKQGAFVGLSGENTEIQ